MKLASAASMIVLCVLVGCASGLSKKVESADWNGRIGTYTYEDAVSELGKPTMTSESNTGRVAEWAIRGSPNMSFGVGVGSGSYGSHTGVGVGAGSSVTPRPHGEYLQLQFTPDDKLSAWSKVKY